MTKRNKLSAATKTRITKLFKQGKLMPEIKTTVLEEYPNLKITTERIKTVLRKHLFGLCDDLWSEAVKLRDGGRCVISKKNTGLNSHHLIGRNNYFYRWDINNGVTLAADHHTLGGNIAAHGATDVTERFAEWMEENRMEQWEWFQLHKNNKQSSKLDVYTLLAVKKRLENVIERLKSQPKADILARKKVDNG